MKSRRFIAGAICPSCGVADRLVVESSQRRCVSCGYRDARPPPDGGRRRHAEGVAKPVRLLDEEP